MLAAKAAIDAVCARHGLQRSDLQARLDILGLDVETVDEDAVNVEKVGAVIPSVLLPLCTAATESTVNCQFR